MAANDEIRDDGRGRGQTPFSVASVRTDSLASRAEDQAERSAPGAATEVSRFGAHGLGAHGEQSPSKMRDGIAPLASAHGSATPAADNEGTAECTGPALPLSPVAKSGVTAGERPGSFVTLIAGGELHVTAAGSRVAVEIRIGKGLRNRLTASLSPEDAERFFRRGSEIVPHARAYRLNSKGA